MRLKQFLKLKEEDNQKSWVLFTRYNLTTLLYTPHKDVCYMISNKSLKTGEPQINFHYEDIIKYIKKHNSMLTPNTLCTLPDTTTLTTNNMYKK